MHDETSESSATTEVSLIPDGPLMLKGELKIELPDGTSLAKESAALCRCGASENKPFCDGGHTAVGFKG